MDSLYDGLCLKVLDCALVCAVIRENAMGNDGAGSATEHLVNDMTRESEQLLEHLREVARRQLEDIKGS